MDSKLWWLEPGAILAAVGIIGATIKALVKGKIDNDKEARKREELAWNHLQSLLEPMQTRVNCLELKINALIYENTKLRERVDEMEQLNERLQAGVEKLIARLVELGQDEEHLNKEIFLT